MTTNIINEKTILIYQTYTDDDTKLIGEPAILVTNYEGNRTIGFETHEDNSVQINYDTLPTLIKLFQGILKEKNFYEIKL